MKQVNLEMIDPIPGRPEVCAVLEAILFAAGCPVTYEKIAQALEITPRKAKEVAEAASLRYSDRGVELLVFDESCQLCTRARYEDAIKTALDLRRTGVLSNASLEVLAVIAYHQPVTRSYIEQVRGVDCSYAVSSLCDKGLIAPTGRLDVPGRPMLYSTTQDFLRVFGLQSLSELPQIDLLTAGAVTDEA